MVMSCKQTTCTNSQCQKFVSLWIKKQSGHNIVLSATIQLLVNFSYAGPKIILLYTPGLGDEAR